MIILYALAYLLIGVLLIPFLLCINPELKGHSDAQSYLTICALIWPLVLLLLITDALFGPLVKFFIKRSSND